ncbi:MAG TPA: hypothetical protein DC023_08095 [Oceanospirillaceae bacterium]|mgnify:CR=1 FL=1|nr:hypothetical protein [Oceanospirillaceae bacterium]
MYINRESEIWKTAPLHVKLSAFGSRRVIAVRRWKNHCFFLGLAGFLVSLLGSSMDYEVLFLLGIMCSPMWLEAFMHWFVLDWLRDNPEALKE